MDGSFNMHSSISSFSIIFQGNQYFSAATASEILFNVFQPCIDNCLHVSCTSVLEARMLSASLCFVTRPLLTMCLRVYVWNYCWYLIPCLTSPEVVVYASICMYCYPQSLLVSVFISLWYWEHATDCRWSAQLLYDSIWYFARSSAICWLYQCRHDIHMAGVSGWSAQLLYEFIW